MFFAQYYLRVFFFTKNRIYDSKRTSVYNILKRTGECNIWTQAWISTYFSDGEMRPETVDLEEVI